MSDPRKGAADHPRNLPEPRNEDPICAAVVHFINERRSEAFKEVSRPDKEDKTQKNVEMVIESPSGARAVIEHTRLESFPGQISDGKRFVQILEPLEKELPPRLPNGKFDLIIDCSVAVGVRGSSEPAVRGTIAEWVVNTAPKLAQHGEEEGEWSIKESVPGVPFDVTLQRWSSSGKPTRLLIARFTPANLAALRSDRVRIALEKKLPKLADCKSRFNATESILVLESDDIALANANAIIEALDQELPKRDDQPDTIYIVETEIPASWVLWIAKEHGDASRKVRRHGNIKVGPCGSEDDDE